MRRLIHRGGLPIPLEPQVFDLLVHLVRHRDHVVSKDELIAAVWGRRIVSDTTIDSRVKAVRQAVGDSGAAQRVVRTVPRKAVRFVADVREEAKLPTLESVPVTVEPAGRRLPSAMLCYANQAAQPLRTGRSGGSGNSTAVPLAAL
jgi:DNA-binding winged helix-turn-helix (wHTH) protein